jgi:hypothetical protein
MLVSHGAKVNHVPNNNSAPFVHAVLLEHEDMCRYLLAHGADMEGDGRWTLLQAVQEGLESMVGFLLRRRRRLLRAICV